MKELGLIESSRSGEEMVADNGDVCGEAQLYFGEPLASSLFFGLHVYRLLVIAFFPFVICHWA